MICLRIKLKKGKQRELITEKKKEYCFTWVEFSDFLNISKSALIEWYRENNLIPYEIYLKLDKSSKFKIYIEETKTNNWGQSKGGFLSKGSTKKINYPGESEELAELIGIILGDGNIHSFINGNKKRTYMLRIAGDYKKDRTYLTEYVFDLCKDLFKIKPKIIIQKSQNGIYVVIHSKKLVLFLNRIGLKSGNKIKNKVDIPKWILINKEFTKACLRGIIDTDGCIHKMSKKDSNLLRINFKNHNKTLLNSTREAFIKLGYSPSKIIRDNVFYISK